MSSETVDHILSATLSEPILEGVLPTPATASVQGPSTSAKGPSTRVEGTLTNTGDPSTSVGWPSTNVGGPSTSVGGPSANVGGPSTGSGDLLLGCTDFATTPEELPGQSQRMAGHCKSSDAVQTQVLKDSSRCLFNVSPTKDVSFPRGKRVRLEETPGTVGSNSNDFLTEQDIDSFLDQIHQ